MADRSQSLQDFVDAAHEAFGGLARDEPSRVAIRRIFAALRSPRGGRRGGATKLAVCDFLDNACEIGEAPTLLKSLVERFRHIEPNLTWYHQEHFDPASASPNFCEGHANAMIVGPGGLENRRDLRLGVTLMAPRVRYPDHNHPPEEVYLVLSDSEFCQGDSEWFSPGIGGSFYNPPGVKHGMRSRDRPLLAFWALVAANNDSIANS